MSDPLPCLKSLASFLSSIGKRSRALCSVAAHYFFVVIPLGTFLCVFYAANSELAMVLLQHCISSCPWAFADAALSVWIAVPHPFAFWDNSV